MGLIIKRPKEWNIKIWKENDTWHEEYIEYHPDTEENREAITLTIPIFKLMFNTIGFEGVKIGKLEKENMIGVKIIFCTKKIEDIADQIVSEFLFITSMGDISLKDLLKKCLKNTILEDFNVIEDEDKK